jgi:hypothetical protein
MKFGTIISAVSIFGVLGHEAHSRLRLDEPMNHIHIETEPPKDCGKFETVAAIDSVTPIRVRLFENLNPMGDFATVTASG